MFPQPNESYSSFFPLSPPTLSYGSLQDIFSSSSAALATNPPHASPPPPPSAPPPPRKDRHRKIHTAKGPRDRRMRLSLDVARKFFDLQDLLAFDKASKTVQWLLNKSKSAIKDHVAASNGKASAPDRQECVSAVFENKQSQQAPPNARKRRSKTPIKPMIARECRDKARARARERTLEKKKKMMTMMQCCRQEELRSNELKLSLEMLEEMGECCSTIFYYSDHSVENLLEDHWEINLVENRDDSALLDQFPVGISYASPIIQPVFHHV